MRPGIPPAVLVAAALALGGGWGSGHAAAASGDAPDLVRLDVLATNEKGLPVAGLRQQDLRLLVDGVPVSIAAFSQAPPPLVLTVLLDVTVSQWHCPLGMAGLPSVTRGVGTGGFGLPLPLPKTLNEAQPIQPAIAEFPIRGLRSDDRVRVGAIGRRLIMEDQFTTDRADIDRAWKSFFELPPVEWLGPSPIWDAAYTSIDAFAREAGLRALVLISDGEASGNLHGFREVAESAALAGVSVSAVAEEAMLPTVPFVPMAAQGIDPAKALRQIAEDTGGAYLLDKATGFPRAPCFSRDPRGSLSKVLDALHHAYTLQFASSVADGHPHHVELQATRPGLNLSYRRTFVRSRE